MTGHFQINSYIPIFNMILRIKNIKNIELVLINSYQNHIFGWVKAGRSHLNLLRINKLAMEHGCRGEKFFALAFKRATALARRRRRAKDFSPLLSLSHRTCLRSRRGRAGAGLGGLRRCNPCQWHWPLAAACALQPIPIRLPHTSRRDRKHVLSRLRNLEAIALPAEDAA
jgi:hypothetical protein